MVYIGMVFTWAPSVLVTLHRWLFAVLVTLHRWLFAVIVTQHRWMHQFFAIIDCNQQFYCISMAVIGSLQFFTSILKIWLQSIQAFDQTEFLLLFDCRQRTYAARYPKGMLRVYYLVQQYWYSFIKAELQNSYRIIIIFCYKGIIKSNK